MRKTNQLIGLIIVSSALLLSSCVPTYKCGDPIPEKKIVGGKKLKNLVKERDELCTNLKTEETENAKLNADLTTLQTEHKTLQGEHDHLNAKYKGLINENMSQADQYGKNLK